MTGGYKKLKKVTVGYKRLQGVQGDKRGYKGLQGVTMDYRNFFLTRTLPHTFSFSSLNKNQSWRISQIFVQNDGLTPLEKF